MNEQPVLNTHDGAWNMRVEDAKKRRFQGFPVGDLCREDLLYIVEGMSLRYEMELGRVYTHAFDKGDGD